MVYVVPDGRTVPHISGESAIPDDTVVVSDGMGVEFDGRRVYPVKFPDQYPTTQWLYPTASTLYPMDEQHSTYPVNLQYAMVD